MQDPRVKGICEGTIPLRDMTLEERSIIGATNEMYKSIDMSSGVEQTMFLYTIFNILDNILNYPYSDNQRILYLSRYKLKIFRLESTLRYLRTLGFEPGTSAETYVYPYDKNLKHILLSRESLVMKVSSKVESTQISDVDAKLGFPTFQKYSDVFGVDLTKKTSKVERDSIYLTLDEV
jgi:hypothetical protein